MAPGRTVPWCCWDEWYMVKNWLLSPSTSDVRKGIQRVEAWRARGRVPLSVDITASLLEAALCDSTIWGASAATAGVRSASVSTCGASQHQLRLQYSAAIVRMVNGIADSQQKGRVALSVNTLAEAAGLSRLLVDVRHESTHNELPSLATLQLAAKQALDWLVSQYWDRQSDHLLACHSRVLDILSHIIASCHAAASKGLASTAADADEDNDDGDKDQQQRAADQKGYQASEGRKHRKQLLSELKKLLPPAHTPLLAELLLQGNTLLLLSTQPHQQQQQKDPQADDIQARKAQQTALAAISRHYPDISQQLVQEVVSRLCDIPVHQQQQQQQGQQQDVEQDRMFQEQQQQRVTEAMQLVSWLELLLPSNTAPTVSTTTTTSSRANKAKRQQQQAAAVDTVSDDVLTECLADVIKANRAAATVACQQQQLKEQLDTEEQQQQSVTVILQKAQLLLLAAVANAPVVAGGSGKAVAHLQKLGQLAAPDAAAGSDASNAGVFEQQQHDSWLQHQRLLLAEAQQQQQQQRTLKKRQRADLQTSSEPAAATAGTNGSSSSSSRKRWRRASSWTAAPVGCLATTRQPKQLLAVLELLDPASTGSSALHQADVAAAAAAAGNGVDGVLQQGQHELGQSLNATAAAAADPMQIEMICCDDYDSADDVDADVDPAAAAVQPVAHAADCIAEDDDAATQQPGSSSDGVVHLGQYWQYTKEEFSQLQQSVKLLL